MNERQSPGLGERFAGLQKDLGFIVAAGALIAGFPVFAGAVLGGTLGIDYPIYLNLKNKRVSG
jgi:hypothetical protein